MSYTAKVIAVFGRTLRAGRWKLADDSLVIAVFGRCVLDLSRAYVDEEDEDLSMTVFALFGSVSVVLPPGCDVEPSGIALLASSEVEIPSEKAEDITQEVLAPMDISWFAMFGRVRINELVIEPEPVVEVEALPPPAVEVFDGGPADDPAADRAAQAARYEAENARRAAARASDAARDADTSAEAEQAALRDEIAQWRSETGRPEADEGRSFDPESEIEPEPEAVEPEPAPEPEVEAAEPTEPASAVEPEPEATEPTGEDEPAAS